MLEQVSNNVFAMHLKVYILHTCNDVLCDVVNTGYVMYDYVVSGAGGGECGVDGGTG